MTATQIDAEEEARAAAHAVPLPGPLLTAFTEPATLAAGLKLEPITAAHFIILQQIDAPFLRRVRGFAQWQAAKEAKPEAALPEPEMEVSFEEACEQIYVVTRPAREARAALAKGRPYFRELALAATADAIPGDLRLLRELAGAVEVHLINSLATRVQYAPPDAGGGTVFTSPPAAQPTASGGGSTTSAP